MKDATTRLMTQKEMKEADEAVAEFRRYEEATLDDDCNLVFKKQGVDIMAERSKDFSIEQGIRKKDLMKKHGHAVLEDIVGDVIVKDPSKMKVEFKDGTKKGIKELVALNEQVTALRKSGVKNMLLGLLGVKE